MIDPALEAAGRAYYEYRAALHAAMDRAGVHDEVLARLLALNAARAGTEAGPSGPGRSRPVDAGTFSAVASDGTSSRLECAAESRRRCHLPGRIT